MTDGTERAGHGGGSGLVVLADEDQRRAQDPGQEPGTVESAERAARLGVRERIGAHEDVAHALDLRGSRLASAGENHRPTWKASRSRRGFPVAAAARAAQLAALPGP